MNLLEKQGISLNWLTDPNNIDLVELDLLGYENNQQPYKQNKMKVIQKHRAAEVAKIIQGGLFGN